MNRVLPSWWTELRPEEREIVGRRGLKAMALAPTLELYGALMRGEQVPEELLDQDALRRYGRRAA